MEFTPKKAVRWDMQEPSLSALGSPFFNGTYDESSIVSTCSLEFVNSQLIAHGFAPAPGLSLEGLSNDASSRVVKCLLGLLGQRVDDMSRTEDLSTKFRTLSYDHERMRTMYQTATEQAANAEREMNLHKSRLQGALKNLQASENAHKQTSAELQRTRNTLQGIRATHQMEMKKREKDIERMTERWQKIADSQAKLTIGAPSGLRCANVAVIEGAEEVGKGQGFLELALEQAEQARTHLSNENLLLRKLVLTAVNEIYSILHQAQSILPDGVGDEEPTSFTLNSLFPMNPPDQANETLCAVLTNVRETLTILSQPNKEEKISAQLFNEEVERLQQIITALQDELALTTKQAAHHVAETRAMFDKFEEAQDLVTGGVGDVTLELMTAPMKDAEQERLDNIRKDLDLERKKFTEAAIAFGKDKAALEAEWVKLLDAKRSWQAEKALSDLSPTPPTGSPGRSPKNSYEYSPKKSPHKSHKSPHKSPRRSPAKGVTVGKAGSGWKGHHPRKPSFSSVVQTVSYETEVILAPTAPPLLSSLKPLTNSLLPTSFTLPPPSPHASLPTKPAFPPAAPLSPPDFSSGPSTATSSSSSSPQSNHLLTTPAMNRLFPVAKPFAQRMIHAYSPAKPSPLSRVTILAESQSSPPRVEHNYSDESLSPTYGSLQIKLTTPEEDIFPSVPPPPPPPREEEMSLSAQLGVESPPDTPLQENKVGPNVTKGRVFIPEPKKAISAKDKGKGKAEPVPRSRTSGLGEKENGLARRKASSGNTGKISPGENTTTSRKITPSSASSKPRAPVKPPLPTTASKPKAPAKSLPSTSGPGPRRVPVGSADAPAIGKGWRG